MAWFQLKNGYVIDPQNSDQGQIRDLWIAKDRLVAAPESPPANYEKIDLGGRLVMAAGIDMHSHIAGGKVNLARQIMASERPPPPVRPYFSAQATAIPPPAPRRRDMRRPDYDETTPNSQATAYRYSEMGYAAAFEPAMLAANARQTHRELGDVAMLHRGVYVTLGNEEFFLRLLASGASQTQINDYVAWMMRRCCAMGVKLVNPGGVHAFKSNRHEQELDTPGPLYPVTPREIIYRLARAVYEIGVRFPLHVHCNNLGRAGNVATTLATIKAAEGFPIHLTHVQFHAYGDAGDHKFSSAAALIAEAVNQNPNVTIDVGQILFGSTITASGDSMTQFRQSAYARPKKYICMDLECEGGCGLVPIGYKNRNFVNGVQWAVGLELFLLVTDKNRIFLTTDHPNGAAFTAYPRIIRLLMDPSYRAEQFAKLHPDAQKQSLLPGLTQAFNWVDIARMTRSGPAQLLGLADHGHLGVGAVADLVVYDVCPATPAGAAMDYAKIFAAPYLMLRGGHVLSQNGEIQAAAWDAAPPALAAGCTHYVWPECDEKFIESRLRPFFSDYLGVRLENYGFGRDGLAEIGVQSRIAACNNRVS
ncbi:MAG: formylmethanofuran dehydrogenase subunit A [Candidatus Symbiobacter sp.]|nr:formylmethanofuran dehydrogenase subunit A [Candidatus Symbiobacter sp.]